MTTVFPAFLKLEHQAGRADQSLLAEINGALAPAERRFAEFSQEARRQLDIALKAPRTSTGSLNLDVTGAREAARAAEQQATIARELARATELAASRNNDFSQSARLAVAATEAQAIEQEQAAATARIHAEAIEQVQNELGKFQSRASAITPEFLGLAQAEAAAADGARLLDAVYRETGSNIDRVSKSARDSASAFEVMFQAAEARSTKAAQDFFNTAFGIDAQAKSARDSARAFEEMFAAQDRANAASRENAAAAAQLRAQLDPLFAAQQRFDQEMSRADDLLEAGAITTREYAAAQQLARDNLRGAAQAITQGNDAVKEGTNAQRSVINSTRASRVAFIQLGQQMQDVTIQAQLGTNAFQIFAQQVPQAAFALSGLEQSANATQARIGKFATFLAGPWGAAIFAATAVIGPLIANLITAGDSADDTANAIESLADEFDFATISAEELARVNELLADTNSEVERTAIAAANATRAKALADQDAAQEVLDLAEAELARINVVRSNPFLAAQAPTSALAEWAGAADETQNRIDDLRESVSGFGAASRRSEFDSRVLTAGMDETALAAERLQTTINGLRQSYAALGNPNDLVTAERLQRELNALRGRGDSEGSGRRARARAERLSDEERAALRAAEATDRYIESLALEITRIGLSEKELRQLEVTRQLALATDEKDRQSIKALNEVRERAIELQKEENNQRELNESLSSLANESERNLTIQRLLLAGRVDEANAMEVIWRWEERNGEAAWDRYDAVLDIVSAERLASEELERQLDLRDAYLRATQDLRGELESLFSGEGADFRRWAQRLQAQLTVESIFGDALREIEEVTRSDFDRNVDFLASETNRASVAIGQLADAAALGANQINDPKYGARLASRDGSIVAKGANDNDTILIERKRQPRDTLTDMTPNEYFELVGRKLVEPLLNGMDDILGPQLADTLGNVLGGGVGGYLQAGPAGGILGALKGLFPDSKLLGDAFGGAVQGQQIGLLADSLGIGFSNTGSAIGGAIGSVLPIPGGQIIGSLAGGLLGKVNPKILGTIIGGPLVGLALDALGIGGTKFGTASFTGGSLGITGSGNKRRDTASTLGSNLQEQLDAIADQLGATVGSFTVSIGTIKDDFRVSTTGRDKKLKNKFSDVTNFGEDEAAALAFALGDAIADGAIRGLTASEQRLLKASKDIEDGLQDVLDFREVSKRLKAYKDPVGAALDELDAEFNRLDDLFKRAGASAAEYAELEELYGIERANAIREATESATGALRSLINDLTIGDSGLSLRDRQSNAIAEYQGLAARVQAGDITAFEDFAQAAQNLLDIERQLFGSQSGYFDRFNEVRDISQAALDQQQALIDAASNRDSPFGDNASVVSAVDNQTTAITNAITAGNTLLQAQNDNLISLIEAMNGNRATAQNRLELYYGRSAGW